MAAHEQEDECVVGSWRYVGCDLQGHRRFPISASAIATHLVDQPARCNRHQPSPRITGHSVGRPLLKGSKHRLLDSVLARFELAVSTYQHAEDLWRLFQDPAVAAWYGTWTFAMAQREAARIADAWAADGVHKWMAYDRLSGALVGRGGPSRAHVAGQDRLEIGWALLRTCWGHGYATEIGRAGLAFAFDELAADEVVSYTETRNARSRAVMERLGFRYSQDFIFEADGVPCALYILTRPS